MSDQPSILQTKQARLRVLEEQAALFGPLAVPPHIAIEIDQLRREIAKLDGSTARAGLPRPPQPDFAHPYPIQSAFTGRVAERIMLTGWLSSSPQPVLAVIGIGGMGKSALTWAWLQRDVLGLPLLGASPDLPIDAAACHLPEAARPEGVLWWSFYETQAGFASFLDEAISYASDGATNPRDLPSTYDKSRVLLSLLQQRRLLLVLDGFERELRAYSSLSAAYQGDDVEKQEHGEHRACTDPHAGRFLRDAVTLPLRSRILITSRLFPRELDELAGCGRRDLATIHPEDAVTFFQSQGIRGTRAEIQAACAPYGYHALALRLLAGVVKKNKRTPGDIKVASQYPVLPDLKGREQHHILQVAYDQLDPPKRGLLSRLAAFRSPMPYEALAALSNYTDEVRFDRALDELEERGLLFFDREQARYDMYPVVRGYAYDRLGDKRVIHIRLYDYFAAIPALKDAKMFSLDALLPTIELYHHAVRAERHEQAWKLFRDRLTDSLYFRLGAYQTCVELLGALFPDGERCPPRLKDESAQAWTLNGLANSYSNSGQPHRAVPLFEAANAIAERLDNKRNVVIGLGNLAYMAQIILGELAAAERNLRRNIALSSEIKDEFSEAVGHQKLGLVLAYQGMFEEASEELKTALASFSRQDEIQSECLVWNDRALRSLFMGDALAALKSGRTARMFADAQSYERDIIQAEWLLGAALVAQATKDGDNKALIEAEVHLTEALTRCRRINLVELEPNILLSWSKWHHLQGNPAQARNDASAGLVIAERCEYRLAQADIHNFLARLAHQAGDRVAARRHAGTAKERAWCDGPPHCYKPALNEAERMLGEIG